MDYFRGRGAKLAAKRVAFVFAAIFVFVASFFIGNVIRSWRRGNAAVLADDVRVEENSPLTYYLKVKYDGVDRQGVNSSDSATAEMYSDTIVVTDKIPDGLIFQNFVTTSSGSIGAVKRSNTNSACPGNVVDDTGSTVGWRNNSTEYVYHGLHYTTANRTVSFKVKGLQAGCQLLVGINTKTPILDGAITRMDFYNTAGYLEGDLTGKSNTTHHWIGRETVTKYQVKYQYSGTVPSDAPVLPAMGEYASGVSVGVAEEPTLAGYTFSGWSTTAVTVNNGSFTMPGSNVTFVGSFTEKPKYTVAYSATGMPENYRVPSTKSYGAGDTVVLDDMAAGTIIDGYRFLGWSVSGVTVSDGKFTMPASNVTINGSFQRIDYAVSYEFKGTAMPSNASSLLPATRSYYPGDTVAVADDPEASGYRFLGWDKDDFKMPESSVTVSGEWAVQSGSFRPTITQRIVNQKDKYYKGEKVQFEIKITNSSNFPIKNVNVGLNLDGAEYTNGTGYLKRTDQLAQIPTLSSGETIALYAEFDVLENITKIWSNVAELLSAEADNGYSLDVSDEAMSSYSVAVSFNTESWNDIPVFTGVDLGQFGPFVILIVLGVLGGTLIVLRSRRSIRNC